MDKYNASGRHDESPLLTGAGAGPSARLALASLFELPTRSRFHCQSATALFAYKIRAGPGWRMTPLTKVTMLNTFSESLRLAGRPTFSGHSFRIGAATYY
ncbi:hypothetical protein CF319_g7208 [Tilletia indica]|nr:hypothetical protein CF319_g7208 [Tilletia indica]